MLWEQTVVTIVFRHIKGNLKKYQSLFFFYFNVCTVHRVQFIIPTINA